MFAHNKSAYLQFVQAAHIVFQLGFGMAQAYEGAGPGHQHFTATSQPQQRALHTIAVIN
jgi:hypothetical protein